MREATARSDADFSAIDSHRPARRKAAAAKPSRFGFLRALTRKPMRILGLVVVAGVLVGIALNATLFQTARHPAPFFTATKEKAAPQKSAAAPAPVATPVPAPRPVEMAARPPAPLAARPAAREQAEAAPAKKDAKDPIAALLKGDAPAADAAPNPKIMAAQRALQKVGFVVKPDGVFGAGTRVAIEKFERDRGLPVTGALAARTVKELSAKSGVAIP